MERLLKSFMKDVRFYAASSNINDFKVEDYYDEDVDVFFLKHNDSTIKEKTDFYEHIAKKMNEYFFSNSITNVCFYYDYEFSQTCKIEYKLPKDMVKELFSVKRDEKMITIKVILPKKELTGNVQNYNIDTFKSLKKELFMDSCKKNKSKEAA